MAELLINQNIAGWLPWLYVPGQILHIACHVAYGAILLVLSRENNRYRTSGICCLIAVTASALASAFSISDPDSSSWTIIFLLPAAVIALVGEYYEYQGHAEILIAVDLVLSEKWKSLWKWFIAMFLSMFGIILVMLIFAFLGILLFFAALIGTIVVSILKLVYLYRTAKRFQEYAKG